MKKDLLFKNMITPVVKDVYEDDRTVVFVASTEDVDRQGDIIRADGWVLENFLKNPVIVWGHDYSKPPVARAIKVWVEDKKLMITAQFTDWEENPFGYSIFKMVKGGFLNAVSVGYFPIEFEPISDQRSGRRSGTEYKKQELYEVSITTIPANPNALVETRGLDVPGLVAKGVLTQEQGEEVSKHAGDIQQETLWLLTIKNAGRQAENEAKLKALTEEVEGLKKKLKDQPQPDLEAAEGLTDKVEQLKARLKALEEGQAPQEPEPEIDETTLTGAIGKAVGDTIRAAVQKEIKFHLGVVD